jgi:hypothetical protein
MKKVTVHFVLQYQVFLETSFVYFSQGG